MGPPKGVTTHGRRTSHLRKFITAESLSQVLIVYSIHLGSHTAASASVSLALNPLPLAPLSKSSLDGPLHPVWTYSTMASLNPTFQRHLPASRDGACLPRFRSGFNHLPSPPPCQRVKEVRQVCGECGIPL